MKFWLEAIVFFATVLMTVMLFNASKPRNVVELEITPTIKELPKTVKELPKWNGIAVDDGDDIFLPNSLDTIIVDDYFDPTYVLTDCEIFGKRRICDRMAFKI